MPQPNDLSRSLVALDQNSTIIAVIEMSQSSWLVAGMLPGIERQPHKTLEPSPERLLAVLHRWRDEAVRAGRTITRISDLIGTVVGRAGTFDKRKPGTWVGLPGILARGRHASRVKVSVFPACRAHNRRHIQPFCGYKCWSEVGIQICPRKQGFVSER